MARFFITFIKVTILVFLLPIALYFIFCLFSWFGNILARFYFIFVYYLLDNYSIKPEMTLGVTSILLFFVLPLSLFITDYQNYWSKGNDY